MMSRIIDKRPNLAASVLLLVVSIALFAPYLTQPDSLMWPRSELGTDMLAYNWPSVHFFRETVCQQGQLPLWQGTSVGGLPMIGNPAIRVYYPLQLLVTLLPIPILWGYALLNVFHFWLAGIGGYWLARSVLKVDTPAALVAGLLVMLTPRLSSNVVGDVGYTHGLCWLPLCLLWTRLAFDRTSWRWALAAGLALCCIYLNNIQYILYAGWLVGLYFIYRCGGMILDRQPLRIWAQQLGILIVILAACVGLSAYQSFTFASYLPYQSRQAMTLTDANYLALPLVGLFNTIFPIAQKFPEWEVYAGLLPLILAPLAIRYAARREVWWWLLLFIFAALFSLGSVTPLYTLMFYGVPGFGFLRVPARMWYVAAIALAMLAALTLDGILRKGTASQRQWRWLWGSAIILMLLTTAGRYLTRRPDELDWLLGIVTSIGVIIALVGLRLWQQSRLSQWTVAALVGAAVLLDLFPLDVAFGTPRPISDFLQPDAVVQSMMQQAGDDLYRVYGVRREIKDQVAVYHHLETVDGLNSFQFASYSQFMRIASGCDLEGLAAAVPPCASDEISQTAYQQAQPAGPLLGLLNVRFVISPIDLSDPAFKLVDTADGERLYENSAVLPRTFIIGRTKVAEGDVYTELGGVDPQAVALLDNQQTLDFTPPENDFFAPATIDRYTPNTIELEANMPDSGLLVLGDPWTPGWTAAVDGQSAPVLRVDGALRGVYLSGGTHHVTFDFRPNAFVIGLTVSGLTVLICVVIIIVRRPKESSKVL
jgi:Bacterial membrane protein YfhO